MNKDNKLRKIGWIYFAVLFSLTLFRILIDSFITKLSDNVLTMVFTAVTQILLMGALPFGLYCAFVAKGSAAQRLQTTSDDFGYRPKLSPAIYIATVLIGLLVFYANYGASYFSVALLRAAGYTFSDNTPTMMPNVGSLIMWLFFTAVLPACFEEMSHRGLLLGTISKYDPKKAVVISALMFALMHQNIVQTFYAFIAGLILGSIALYTKSIIPPMIIHFMNNAMSVLIEYSQQHGGKLFELFESLFSDVTLVKFGLLIVTWAVAYYGIVKLLSKIKIYCSAPSVQATEQKAVFDLSENAGLIFSIVLGITTTVITFIWGLAR